MDTLFAHNVRAFLEETNRSQKEFASEIFESQEPSELKLDTINSKLSKLLNGDPEGETLLSNNPRKSAFAQALGVTVKWVDEKLSASKARRTLILDSLISPELIDQIMAKQSPETFLAVAVDATPSADTAEAKNNDERLKKLAAKHKNPLVVLDRDRRQDFYRGADLETTTVKASGRGPVLLKYEELIPLDPPPPPPPPLLFDEDKSPLFPCESFAVAKLNQSDSQWQREHKREQIELDGKLEREPSFPILDVIRHLILLRLQAELADATVATRISDYTEDGIQDSVLIDLLPRGRHVKWNYRQPCEQKDAFDRLTGAFPLEDDGKTALWFRDSKFYAAGPLAPKLADLFAPHHPDLGAIDVTQPPLFAKLAARNPWRLRESEDWPKLAERFATETGGLGICVGTKREKDPDNYMHMIETEVDLPEPTEAAALQYLLWRHTPEQEPTRSYFPDADEEKSLRVFIRGLSARAYIGSASKALLLLQAMLDVSFVAHPTGFPTEVVNVTADMGAGNLITLVAYQYKDRPVDFRRDGAERTVSWDVRRDAVGNSRDMEAHRAREDETHASREPFWDYYDGGDIRFVLSRGRFQQLEGTSRTGRDRRDRLEEERLERERLQAIEDEQDAYDDWDD